MKLYLKLSLQCTILRCTPTTLPLTLIHSSDGNFSFFIFSPLNFAKIYGREIFLQNYTSSAAGGGASGTVAPATARVQSVFNFFYFLFELR
jgi:hypothetical protein